MSFKQFFYINNLYFYVELNTYLVGTELSFFKYKFNSSFFFFIIDNIFYFFYFSLLENSNNINSLWKKNKYLFFSFFKSNIFYNIKHLKLEGRGYKLYYYLNYVIFKLGYSHLCYFLLPLNVSFFSKKKKSHFKVVSLSNELIGNLLFRMQSFRIPNTFKKKGIFIA
jgi:hypothetical protein